MASTEPGTEVLQSSELEACVEAIFAHYRATGFPVYDLTRQERVERLASFMAFDHSTVLKNGVIRQTMHGVSLCWHYHPHMFDIRCGDRLTPMEVFLDDYLFKRAIAKRLSMGGYISDGGVRKALCTFSGTQRVSTFRPTAAAAVYHELLPASGGAAWDFSGGFGGRLLGALACDRVKKYIATEPSTLTMEGLEEMASEIVPLSRRRIEVELHRVGSEDFIPERNSLDCAFSSPPYFDWEKYSNEPSQSYIRYPNPKDWIHEYLGRTLANCRNGLKSSGVLAVNIAAVRSYPELETEFLGVAHRQGWRPISTLYIEMSRMVGTKSGHPHYKREPLYLFRKR